MSSQKEGWGFSKGDEITPDLSVMRLLGGGLAYEAYLAYDEVTLGPVVVKVLRPDQVDDRGSVRLLRREIETLVAVNHPAVVRSLRSDLEDERPYVVLEHVEGPRLSSLIRRHGPLPEQQYLPLAVEVSSALHYLALLGYVHLDIKPGNIIMGAPAKLIDLSLARAVDAARELTHVVGTDAYMAPEQCDPQGHGQPGPASDVWGLGATLYEAIEGKGAFDDRDPASERLDERLPQLVRPAPRFTRRVAADVEELVFDCLAPDPADRPLPREVAARLEPALARTPRGRLVFKVR